jgi:hypothetical protein
MDLLVSIRSTVCIQDENPYFFASQTVNDHIDGGRVLRDMTNSANLSHPEHITSTSLRKYVSTVAQVKAISTHYFFNLLLNVSFIIVSAILRNFC